MFCFYCKDWSRHIARQESKPQTALLNAEVSISPGSSKQKCWFARAKPKDDTMQSLLHTSELRMSIAKQASQFNKLPSPSSIIHTLTLFSKGNKLLQSSSLANRLTSYWRKDCFGKITKTIQSLQVLWPTGSWDEPQVRIRAVTKLGWPLLFPFLFGCSWVVAQDTNACPPRAHIAAMHFFSRCSCHSFQL